MKEDVKNGVKNDVRNDGKGRRQSSVDRSRGFFSQDLEEGLDKVRPLNESWKRKYEKWKFGNEAKVSKT
jgi:hypothetical protein